MHVVAVPVLGIILNILLQCVEANLTLDFKITKISASHKPANCNVANTTYSHGETFKLDCKTQCVCENGRHACSSLCPKEQLPAPEDTISCRSPRLVEVPGHCCKMWLCENPTADVYATCHNSSTSPWTPCSQMCGLGISTRFTTTTAGCNQLSNLRLCENRKCEVQQDNTDKRKRQYEQYEQAIERKIGGKQKFLTKTKQLKHKLKWQHRQLKHRPDSRYQQPVQQEHLEYEHRIRKGHECRSLQRLGPARIRLDQCVSKKLYRPKICGRCHQNTKCCVPSLSTTIQVELLCPLNAMDPISFVQQQLKPEQEHGQLFNPRRIASADVTSSLNSLWDTHALDAIDQEYLQSHQIQIVNKFIAVEWILKCECSRNDNCQRIVNTTAATSRRFENSSSSKTNNHKYRDYDNNENVEIGNNLSSNKNMQTISRFRLKKDNNYNGNSKSKNTMFNEDYERQLAEGVATQIDKIPDDNKNVDKHDDVKVNANKNEDNADNDDDINIKNSYSSSNEHIYSFSYKKQTKDYVENNNNKNKMLNNQNDIDGDGDDDDEEKIENVDVKEKEWSTSLSSSLLSSPPLSSFAGLVTASSDEIQPDIIPYPPPPFSANKHTNNKNSNNKNKHKITQANWMKDKSKLPYSKQNKQQQRQKYNHQQQQHQQFHEHWLQQQHNNNKPYETVSLAT